MTDFMHYTDASLKNGDIVTDLSVDKIAKLVDKGDVVVVRRFLPFDHLKSLVDEIYGSFEGVEPKLMDLRWGCENHWRIDDNPPKSSIPKAQSVYITFHWNEGLEQTQLAGRMLGRLRNRIAGLNKDFGFRPDDDHIAMSVYQHYPCGGGFIGEHVDPVEPQKCVINLNLPGQFESGGLFFFRHGQKIPAEHLSDTGDLVIFKPDMCHGVDDIDPEKSPLDYYAITGRWRMACVLTENPLA